MRGAPPGSAPMHYLRTHARQCTTTKADRQTDPTADALPGWACLGRIRAGGSRSPEALDPSDQGKGRPESLENRTTSTHELNFPEVSGCRVPLRRVGRAVSLLHECPQVPSRSISALPLQQSWRYV